MNKPTQEKFTLLTIPALIFGFTWYFGILAVLGLAAVVGGIVSIFKK